MWVKVEGRRGLVKEWCQKYEYRGSPSVVLFNKMQALKDLKLWNREVFGNVTTKKEVALEMINYQDNIEGQDLFLKMIGGAKSK